MPFFYLGFEFQVQDSGCLDSKVFRSMNGLNLQLVAAVPRGTAIREIYCSKQQQEDMEGCEDTTHRHRSRTILVVHV